MSTRQCERCGSNTTYDDHWCEKCYASFNSEKLLLKKYYSPSVKAVKGVQLLLEGLKETYPQLNLDTKHFEQTPHRVARMFTETLWGLAIDETKLMETAFEEVTYMGIVAVTNIGFTSLCKHHLAIFRGIAHVGYIPERRLIGLSKINRLVETIAARPQVQEHITYQVAETIDKILRPKGVAVVMEGSHDCIAVRGVKSKGSVTKTSEMRGCFLENSKDCKTEFFKLIENNSPNKQY